MQPLPEPLPQSRPGSTPDRYLSWIGRHQWRSILAGCCYDIVWLVGLALVPWAIGRAIDDGVVGRDGGRLFFWALVLLGLVVLHAAIEGLRDRAGVINWTRAAFRSMGLVGRRIASSGQAVNARIAAGEVATTAAGDSMGLANIYYMIGAFVSSLVAYAVVGVLLLRASTGLGLVILIGVPLCSAVFFVVARPLRARQGWQREQSGRMTTLGADTVVGLRVLRGIGGERMFVDRYRAASAATRDAGFRIATPLAIVEGLQVLITGGFAVALTWLGALLVHAGELTPGDLVAFFGYAAFLVMPIQLAAVAVSTYTRAQVGATRILGLLRIEPATREATEPAGAPAGAVPVEDTESGLRIPAGTIAAVVSDDSAAVEALAERIARLHDDDPAGAGVRLGGVPARRLPVVALRRHVTLADSEPYFFRGTLRDQLDPHDRHDDAGILAAIRAAGVEEVLDTLPAGLDSPVFERGRTFSGGQRQRLGLARAYLADPPLLVLLGPTSAVDTHTESRIAERLRPMRDGSSTLVLTTSPLLLAIADEVHLLQEGRIVATGRHSELMDASAAYRTIVQRAAGLE